MALQQNGDKNMAYYVSEIIDYIDSNGLFETQDRTLDKLYVLAKTYQETEDQIVKDALFDKSVELTYDIPGMENFNVEDMLPKFCQSIDERKAEIRAELYHNFMINFDIEGHIEQSTEAAAFDWLVVA